MNKNFSYTYLLPLLSEQIDIKKKLLSFILNTYCLSHKESIIETNNFYILCKFNYSSSSFVELENTLINNSLFIDSYEDNDKILYEFKFPEEYAHEKTEFLKGNYSLFEDDAKKLVLRFWSEYYGHIPSFVSNTLSKIKHILYKDERLRSSMNKELKINIEKGKELGNKVDIREETYIFNNDEKEINLNNIEKIF